MNAVIEKTTVENQTHGLYAGANARVITRGSVYSGHLILGFWRLEAALLLMSMLITASLVIMASGFIAAGRQAIIRAAASVITGNNAGVTADGSGVVATFFDNKLQGNTWDGGFNLGLTTN